MKLSSLYIVCLDFGDGPSIEGEDAFTSQQKAEAFIPKAAKRLVKDGMYDTEEEAKENLSVMTLDDYLMET